MRVYTRRRGGVGVSGGWFVGSLILILQAAVWICMALLIGLVYCGAAVLAVAGGGYLRFKNDDASWAENTAQLWRGLTRKVKPKGSR